MSAMADHLSYFSGPARLLLPCTFCLAGDEKNPQLLPLGLPPGPSFRRHTEEKHLAVRGSMPGDIESPRGPGDFGIAPKRRYGQAWRKGEGCLLGCLHRCLNGFLHRYLQRFGPPWSFQGGLRCLDVWRLGMVKRKASLFTRRIRRPDGTGRGLRCATRAPAPRFPLLGSET